MVQVEGGGLQGRGVYYKPSSHLSLFIMEVSMTSSSNLYRAQEWILHPHSPSPLWLELAVGVVWQSA